MRGWGPLRPRRTLFAAVRPLHLLSRALGMSCFAVAARGGAAEAALRTSGAARAYALFVFCALLLCLAAYFAWAYLELFAAYTPKAILANAVSKVLHFGAALATVALQATVHRRHVARALRRVALADRALLGAARRRVYTRTYALLAAQVALYVAVLGGYLAYDVQATRAMEQYGALDWLLYYALVHVPHAWSAALALCAVDLLALLAHRFGRVNAHLDALGRRLRAARGARFWRALQAELRKCEDAAPAPAHARAPRTRFARHRPRRRQASPRPDDWDAPCECALRAAPRLPPPPPSILLRGDDRDVTDSTTASDSDSGASDGGAAASEGAAAGGADGGPSRAHPAHREALNLECGFGDVICRTDELSVVQPQISQQHSSGAEFPLGHNSDGEGETGDDAYRTTIQLGGAASVVRFAVRKEQPSAAEAHARGEHQRTEEASNTLNDFERHETHDTQEESKGAGAEKTAEEDAVAEGEASDACGVRMEEEEEWSADETDCEACVGGDACGAASVVRFGVRNERPSAVEAHARDQHQRTEEASNTLNDFEKNGTRTREETHCTAEESKAAGVETSVEEDAEQRSVTRGVRFEEEDEDEEWTGDETDCEACVCGGAGAGAGEAARVRALRRSRDALREAGRLLNAALGAPLLLLLAYALTATVACVFYSVEYGAQLYAFWLCVNACAAAAALAASDACAWACARAPALAARALLERPAAPARAELARLRRAAAPPLRFTACGLFALDGAALLAFAGAAATSAALLLQFDCPAAHDP